jgi:hypothetical protein
MVLRYSVSLTIRALFHKNIFISVFYTHFYEVLHNPQGLLLQEGLGIFIKFMYLVGFRTRDLPSYTTAPRLILYHSHIELVEKS